MNQALVVIDAQQALIEGTNGEKGVFEKERLITCINQVVSEAMDKKIPIIFVRDVDVASGEGDGFQIHQDIHVPSDATILNKAATNAFYGTNLTEILRDNGIQHIVIMGCQTEYCIDTAVRAATALNFDVTLVEDGHSTSDSKILSANQIIKHHNKTLHGLDNVDNFSLVRNSKEGLFSPVHNNYR